MTERRRVPVQGGRAVQGARHGANTVRALASKRCRCMTGRLAAPKHVLFSALASSGAEHYLPCMPGPFGAVQPQLKRGCIVLGSTSGEHKPAELCFACSPVRSNFDPPCTPLFACVSTTAPATALQCASPRPRPLHACPPARPHPAPDLRFCTRPLCIAPLPPPACPRLLHYRPLPAALLAYNTQQPRTCSARCVPHTGGQASRGAGRQESVAPPISQSYCWRSTISACGASGGQAGTGLWGWAGTGKRGCVWLEPGAAALAAEQQPGPAAQPRSCAAPPWAPPATRPVPRKATPRSSTARAWTGRACASPSPCPCGPACLRVEVRARSTAGMRRQAAGASPSPRTLRSCLLGGRTGGRTDEGMGVASATRPLLHVPSLQAARPATPAARPSRPPRPTHRLRGSCAPPSPLSRNSLTPMGRLGLPLGAGCAPPASGGGRGAPGAPAPPSSPSSPTLPPSIAICRAAGRIMKAGRRCAAGRGRRAGQAQQGGCRPMPPHPAASRAALRPPALACAADAVAPTRSSVR